VARLRDLVDAARTPLVAAGIPVDEAALDAELLMRDVLAWDRASWITRREEAAAPAVAQAFARAIARRAGREPVAYIRGVQEFYGRAFQVRPGVLIPRPETELLIDEALTLLAGQATPRIADVGTGSGCLAITLALETPGATVAATDISADALAIARANATALGMTTRIDFRHTSLLDGVSGLFDLLVANPPYVPERDASSLAPEVLAHEPLVFGRTLFGETQLEVPARDVAPRAADGMQHPTQHPAQHRQRRQRQKVQQPDQRQQHPRTQVRHHAAAPLASFWRGFL